MAADRDGLNTQSAAALTTLLVVVVLIVRHQVVMLNYLDWGDESETVVTSKMLAAGMRLYSDVFNHHGPLTFLPGVLLEQLSPGGIAEHRVIVMVCQLATLAAVFLSPLLQTPTRRSVATVLIGTAMVVYLPNHWGHMYVYQAFAGMLILVALVLYVMPAILASPSLSRTHVLIGNVLLACLPFLAVTYVPLTALLWIAGLRTRYVRMALSAFMIATVANIIALAWMGSISGFVAYHLYLNLVILPEFAAGNSLFASIAGLVKSVLGAKSIVGFALVVVASCVAMVRRCPRESWRVTLLGLALGSLLARGAGFYALPFYYAALSMIALIGIVPRPTAVPAKALVALAALGCIVKLSLLWPGDREQFEAYPVTMRSEFAELAKALTDPSDRILVYTFLNNEYLMSGRLPASAHFFYFPWQARYNESPILGIKADPCDDIRTVRPKLIFLDEADVWGRFPWRSYAGCIQDVVDADYSKLGERPYYVRVDLRPAAESVLQRIDYDFSARK
jgi:hypothetical protein